MTNETLDKQSSIPLTIENAVLVVAREHNLVPDSLQGSVSSDGFQVIVTSKDCRDAARSFVVITLAHARAIRLKEIEAYIAEDAILGGRT
jgi:hypothetical protein